MEYIHFSEVRQRFSASSRSGKAAYTGGYGSSRCQRFFKGTLLSMIPPGQRQSPTTMLHPRFPAPRYEQAKSPGESGNYEGQIKHNICSYLHAHTQALAPQLLSARLADWSEHVLPTQKVHLQPAALLDQQHKPQSKHKLQAAKKHGCSATRTYTKVQAKTTNCHRFASEADDEEIPYGTGFCACVLWQQGDTLKRQLVQQDKATMPLALVNMQGKHLPCWMPE
ncbi:hypothetical protein Anapl_09041 [Anas platyrhynchos]|uniref:Uncharacterized protein n=1 Tax=Anas platyrhynchos TaxID=8839 RepID=R0JBZ6_ANAPL|nr:hypothetical protein Anapl_09041 [Anas platyrhynchos]